MYWCIFGNDPEPGIGRFAEIAITAGALGCPCNIGKVGKGKTKNETKRKKMGQKNIKWDNKKKWDKTGKMGQKRKNGSRFIQLA